MIDGIDGEARVESLIVVIGSVGVLAPRDGERFVGENARPGHVVVDRIDHPQRRQHVHLIGVVGVGRGVGRPVAVEVDLVKGAVIVEVELDPGAVCGGGDKDRVGVLRGVGRLVLVAGAEAHRVEGGEELLGQPRVAPVADVGVPVVGGDAPEVAVRGQANGRVGRDVASRHEVVHRSHRVGRDVDGVGARAVDDTDVDGGQEVGIQDVDVGGPVLRCAVGGRPSGRVVARRGGHVVGGVEDVGQQGVEAGRPGAVTAGEDHARDGRSGGDLGAGVDGQPEGGKGGFVDEAQRAPVLAAVEAERDAAGAGAVDGDRGVLEGDQVELDVVEGLSDRVRDIEVLADRHRVGAGRLHRLPREDLDRSADEVGQRVLAVDQSQRPAAGLDEVAAVETDIGGIARVERHRTALGRARRCAAAAEAVVRVEVDVVAGR